MVYDSAHRFMESVCEELLNGLSGCSGLAIGHKTTQASAENLFFSISSGLSVCRISFPWVSFPEIYVFGLKLLEVAKLTGFEIGGPLRHTGGCYLIRYEAPNFCYQCLGAVGESPIESLTPRKIFRFPVRVQLFLPADAWQNEHVKVENDIIAIIAGYGCCHIQLVRNGESFQVTILEKYMSDIKFPLKLTLGILNLSAEQVLDMRVGSTFHITCDLSVMTLELEDKRLAKCILTEKDDEPYFEVIEIFPDTCSQDQTIVT